MLAIGVALGAVGLAEIAGTKQGPFENGWVIAGVAVAAVGSFWVLGTFVLSVIETAKTQALQDLIGRSLTIGDGLINWPPTEQSGDMVANWTELTRDLIRAGLGQFEADLFLSDYDLGLSHKEIPSEGGRAWLHRRLIRLSRLLDRAHVARAAITFRPNDFRKRLSSDDFLGL